MDNKNVTASELAQYVYCQCCWIDSIEGKKMTTEAMKSGIEGHNEVLKRLKMYKVINTFAFITIIICTMLLIYTVYYYLTT